MPGLMSTLALFRASLRGEDAVCMTIDAAHRHYHAGKPFPARVILDPGDHSHDKDECIRVHDIDFGTATTVSLPAHDVELDTVTAGKFIQTAPPCLFGGPRENRLYAHDCTLGAVQTRNVENIRAIHNHGAMELTAAGVAELYLRDNDEQTTLHVSVDDLQTVIISGCDRLHGNETLDLLPVPVEGHTELMVTDGDQFRFHKLAADRDTMRDLVRDQIERRENMVRAAYEENRADAAVLETRLAPKIADYAAMVATLDAYPGKAGNGNQNGTATPSRAKA